MRPKESLSANMRLFFGVDPETEAGKSKSGYNLKVGNIALNIRISEKCLSGIKNVFSIKPDGYRISTDNKNPER